MAARGLPVGPELQAAVARRLLALADRLDGIVGELSDFSDGVDMLLLLISPASETNPGVEGDAWAAYVDAECRSMLDQP